MSRSMSYEPLPPIRMKKAQELFKRLKEDVRGLNDNRDGADESQRDAYKYAEAIRKDVLALRRELVRIFDEANWLGTGNLLKNVRVVVYKPSDK